MRILSCLIFLVTTLFGYSEPARVLHTSVPALPGEDLAHPCEYDLSATPSIDKEFRGVFVIFERGRDIQRFYVDPVVRSFAERQGLAILMAHHCASKQYEDMDIDPTKGLGRALFQALDQFATEASHPELKTSPLVLLGFSGAGAFAGRLTTFAPSRIAAAILANPGQFDPLGLDMIEHSASSRSVPELILVGGRDDHVGTERAYAYFTKSWNAGAPWLFVTQNNVPHCCVVNARNLILDWLTAVLKMRLGSNVTEIRPVERSRGYEGFIQLKTTDTRDNWKLPTSNAAEPLVHRAGEEPPKNWIPSGWLPSKSVAEEWRGFVAQESHPTSSIP